MKRLQVEQLEPRTVPSSVGGKVTIDGNTFTPFDNYTGPLNIANTEKHIIVGAGEGGGPRVVVINKENFQVVANFFAFEESFRGGVRVAGDDKVIYVAAGPGGGPVV